MFFVVQNNLNKCSKIYFRFFSLNHLDQANFSFEGYILRGIKTSSLKKNLKDLKAIYVSAWFYNGKTTGEGQEIRDGNSVKLGTKRQLSTS